MATTTNYGWVTPDDTDLVKDGAAAIRTLGTSVDTTVHDNEALAIAKTFMAAKGDLISATANDTPSILTVGANGTTLVADSAEATGLKWATPSSGGFTLIAEQQASAATSISFTGIAATFDQLLLVWSGLTASAGSTTFFIRINNSSSAIYAQMGLRAAGGSPAISNGAGNEVGFNGLLQNVTSGAMQLLPKGFLTIDNYASSTRVKNFEYVNSFRRTATADDFYETTSGVFNSNSAITSIDIVRTSGAGTLSNAASTSIRLYGIN